MRYAYLLRNANGLEMVAIYNQERKPKDVLKEAQQSHPKQKWNKCLFYKHIPYGFHLCGCGALVVGSNDDVLCPECAMTYGHRFAHQL
jgi:hypothetical protein